MFALAINYRLAPETKFPGALYDVVQSYLYLIDPNEKHRLDPKNIIVMGDSAGGGLCLAMMLYLRDHELPQPEGAVLLSVSEYVMSFFFTRFSSQSVYNSLGLT
jgi:acetyl esterase/lipase